MKRILYVSMVALCAIFVASCVKDKGNYDYTDNNAPEWNRSDTITRTFRRLTGDVVTIKSPYILPPSSDTYTYAWYQVTNSNDGDPNKKDLVAETDEFTVTVGTTNARYMFRMMNNRTGVWYTDPDRYNIEVAASTTSSGFLFLTQNGADIDFELLAVPVSEHQPEWTLYSSAQLWAGYTPDELPDTAGRTAHYMTAVNNATGYMPDNTQDQIWITTNLGTQQLTPNYKKGKNLSAMFNPTSDYVSASDVLVPTTIRNVLANGNPYSMGMYLNGNWFYTGYRSNASGPSPFTAFRNAVNIMSEFYADPVGHEEEVEPFCSIGHSNLLMLMWSSTEGKFLLKGGTSGTAQPNSAYLTTSKWVLDDVPTNVDNEVQATGSGYNFVEPGRTVVHMGEYNPGSGSGSSLLTRAYAIVNDGGTYKVLNYSLSGAGNIAKNSVVEFPGGTSVGNAKPGMIFGGILAGGTGTANWPYIYYVTNDNKVFALSLEAQTETEVTSSINPNNHEIVAMKNFSASFSSASPQPTQETNTNRTGSQICNTTFYVVTKDSAATDPTKPCTLTVWNMNSTNPDVTMAQYVPLVWDPEKNNGNGGDKDWAREDRVPMQFSGIGDVVDFAFLR